jgi:hypothetical protein
MGLPRSEGAVPGGDTFEVWSGLCLRPVAYAHADTLGARASVRRRSGMCVCHSSVSAVSPPRVVCALSLAMRASDADRRVSASPRDAGLDLGRLAEGPASGRSYRG